MNLILFSDADVIGPGRVRLDGRRFLHVRDVLKAKKGQTLQVGKINGLMGQGTVARQGADSLELDVKLDSRPPDALPLTLIFGLTRPPMLRRILFSAAMLGVKKIIILNFNRVEKSLWNSSSLKPQAIADQLVLGLEQAKDTMMPEVILKKGFKPFVEDELPALMKDKLALVAHPEKEDQVIPAKGENVIPAKAGTHARAAAYPEKPAIVIIGPEGGIIDYEMDALKRAGCRPMDLGPRIIRAESVLPFIIGKLF
jgi:16S rRNA (uracil1498-N3)-methyltransferase